MKVHLFGLPKSAHIRLKAESAEWADAVPSPHKFRATPLLSNDLGDVGKSDIDELAKAIGEGFTHIVLAGVREWKKIYASLQYDCRIHLTRIVGSLRGVAWSTLQQSLHSIVAVDETWLARLSPRTLKHPLLLPPSTFATSRETADFWRHCDVYSEDLFSAGEQILGEVEKYHLRPDPQGARSWLDNRHKRYRIDRSKHARSEAERSGAKSYRFCFELPPGFHYDVSDDSGNPFVVLIDGRPCKVTHCNITPWGRVRRG